jgi:hypothetical protein
MILARSSRPERYRLSPPIAGCRLSDGNGQRARSTTGQCAGLRIRTVEVRILPCAPLYDLRNIQRCCRRFAVGHTTKGPDIIRTGAQLEQIAPFEMMKNAKNLPTAPPTRSDLKTSIPCAGPTSTGSRRACCASSTRSSARGDTPRAFITRDGRRSPFTGFAAPLLIHPIGPRSSMDRAPSFYLGTVRVRVLPRAPTTIKIHHFDSIRPRSSMDQSGGVRSLRLRVRIAPWTPF